MKKIVLNLFLSLISFALVPTAQTQSRTCSRAKRIAIDSGVDAGIGALLGKLTHAGVKRGAIVGGIAGTAYGWRTPPECAAAKRQRQEAQQDPYNRRVPRGDERVAGEEASKSWPIVYLSSLQGVRGGAAALKTFLTQGLEGDHYNFCVPNRATERNCPRPKYVMDISVDRRRSERDWNGSSIYGWPFRKNNDKVVDVETLDVGVTTIEAETGLNAYGRSAHDEATVVRYRSERSDYTIVVFRGRKYKDYRSENPALEAAKVAIVDLFGLKARDIEPSR